MASAILASCAKAMPRARGSSRKRRAAYSDRAGNYETKPISIKTRNNFLFVQPKEDDQALKHLICGTLGRALQERSRQRSSGNQEPSVQLFFICFNSLTGPGRGPACGFVHVVVPAKASENRLAELPYKTVATVLPTAVVRDLLGSPVKGLWYAC